MTTDEFRLTTRDDDFHPAPNDDPYWNETVWFSFSVPERAIHGYVYPWVRRNQEICGGGVMVWDGMNDHPWDCLHWNYHWNTPLGPLGDLRDYTFPQGIHVRCLEPMQKYHVTYDHPDCGLDILFEGIVEPHAVGLGESWDEFFAGHLDQCGHVTGTLRLGRETIPVDCYAMRDRSWGPRVETNFHVGYNHGQSAKAAFLAWTYLDGSASDVAQGYLWRDGERALLVSGSQELHRDGPRPRRSIIRGTDALGRSFEAVGECVNYVPFANLPWMFNWLTLARWELEGSDGQIVEAWGEMVESWHVDDYRRFARSLR
jgi:hypothetical protein